MSEQTLLHNDRANNRASLISLFANTFLALIKLIAGIIGSSQALVSDAINSIDDVISTVVVVIGVKKSQKSPDAKHQYGHERFDNVASIILAIIFILTAFGVGASAIMTMIIGRQTPLQLPNVMTSIVAGVAMLIKEILFVFTYRTARKTGSTSLRGMAIDHQVDVFSTGITLIGIILAIVLKLPVLDAVAALVSAVLILYSAIRILVNAINQMIDRAAPRALVEQIKQTITSVDGVDNIDLLRTRIFGAKIYVEVEIAVNPLITLNSAHLIAENVHDLIEKDFSNIKHIMVHVNPSK